jgi:hypothetical protein
MDHSHDPTYHPGETVFGTLSYCKTNSVPRRIRVETCRYQSQEAMLPTGCHDSVIVIEKIAPDAHAGTLSLCGRTRFQDEFAEHCLLSALHQ